MIGQQPRFNMLLRLQTPVLLLSGPDQRLMRVLPYHQMNDPRAGCHLRSHLQHNRQADQNQPESSSSMLVSPGKATTLSQHVTPPMMQLTPWQHMK